MFFSSTQNFCVRHKTHSSPVAKCSSPAQNTFVCSVSSEQRWRANHLALPSIRQCWLPCQLFSIIPALFPIPLQYQLFPKLFPHNVRRPTCHLSPQVPKGEWVGLPYWCPTCKIQPNVCLLCIQSKAGNQIIQEWKF